MLDKKAASFLGLGLIVGVLLATSAFALVLLPRQRPASGSGGGPQRPVPVVLELAHAMDTSQPVHRAMELLAKRLAEKSNQSVQVEIYPNGQLGSESETLHQVRQGALAMTKASAATLEGFSRRLAVFGLPYLFDDERHYWRVLDGEVGRQLLEELQPVGLRGLCYYDAGSRSFFTRSRPILEPSDLQGKKIRVMNSRTAMDMVSQLGGSPTPIAWGELYTALQQGMVDGGENNPPSLYYSRHYEVARHYSLNEHTRIPDVLIVSQKVWDSLTAEAQRWLREAAQESSRFQRKLWQEQTAASLEALERAGVTIHRPSKAAFAERVKPLYERPHAEPLAALVGAIRRVGGEPAAAQP